MPHREKVELMYWQLALAQWKPPVRNPFDAVMACEYNVITNKMIVLPFVHKSLIFDRDCMGDK